MYVVSESAKKLFLVCVSVKRQSERNNLIVMRIAGRELPIAFKDGHKVYRICPICGAVFETAKGWYKHINTFHPMFFDVVNALRLNELKNNNVDVEFTGKACIDKLIMLMKDVEYVEYYEYDHDKHVYNGIAIDKNEFIEFLKNFTCSELKIKYVKKMSDGMYVGRKMVDWYFAFGSGNYKVRFIVNELIRNGIINKIIQAQIAQQNKQQQNKQQNNVPIRVEKPRLPEPVRVELTLPQLPQPKLIETKPQLNFNPQLNEKQH